ncbi:MAG: hydroxymethylglutaryl-CoA lyase [Chlorobi bacterium]|nr:hydroxymethylglutaryl-CoA lyase [Chlorobiota bacterium]
MGLQSKEIKILETPRDAMQGLHTLIPLEKKVELIDSLLKVGFDILDVGSFVSPKAIPQMADTAEVIRQIDLSKTNTELFSLVVTESGGATAAGFREISYIGFPFSTSETFLRKNIRSDFNKSMETISGLQEICLRTHKTLVVYLSMAFGNPYGDPAGKEIILQWVDKLYKKGVSVISLSDITGVATPVMINDVYSSLALEFPQTEFGLHLHTTGENWYNKIDAAYKQGCRLFDGVVNGFGGCPMTGYELLGNLPTGNIIEYAEKNSISLKIDKEQFVKSRLLANEIFA